MDLATAPDAAACWAGRWQVVPVREEVWAQAAITRTVAGLPATHPWRLGGAKAASRLLQWIGRPTDDGGTGVAVLAVTAADADLDRCDAPDDELGDQLRALGLGRIARQDLASDVGGRLVGAAAAAARNRTPWAGAVVRLAGAWLPPTVWLPRVGRDPDEPGTDWPTESVDFDDRYTVHAADLRCAADLLTPAVMALALDVVPPAAAVTVAGDALHLWWPHRGAALADAGRVARAVAAAEAIAAAFPHFVLAAHPDRSSTVEDALRLRHEQADAYRAARQLGRSVDPVLQRIYQKSRSDLG